MKIHKALKVKNRLTGELNKLKEVVNRENSRRNDNASKIDCSKVMSELLEVSNKLNRIKTAIAEANVGIYGSIDLMGELKNLISFYTCLDTREGEEVAYLGGDQQTTFRYTAFLNKEEVELRIRALQNRINELQDKIDDYNAITDVNYQE